MAQPLFQGKPCASRVRARTQPATLEEAVQVAEESEFLRRVLPEGLSKRYFSEELKRCAALRSAPDRAEHERVYYFNAI